MCQEQMQAMRNGGNDSSLSQWLWVGWGCHIISQQTNSKQEEEKKTDQACFQGFAKLPHGDWWVLLHDTTRFFALSPNHFLISINNPRAKTVHSAEQERRMQNGGLCNNRLKNIPKAFERSVAEDKLTTTNQKVRKASGRKNELVAGLFVDFDTEPNPLFQHKSSKFVATCSHPLFAQDADTIIATFKHRWHITGSHTETEQLPLTDNGGLPWT